MGFVCYLVNPIQVLLHKTEFHEHWGYSCVISGWQVRILVICFISVCFINAMTCMELAGPGIYGSLNISWTQGTFHGLWVSNLWKVVNNMFENCSRDLENNSRFDMYSASQQLYLIIFAHTRILVVNLQEFLCSGPSFWVISMISTDLLILVKEWCFSTNPIYHQNAFVFMLRKPPNTFRIPRKSTWSNVLEMWMQGAFCIMFISMQNHKW